MPPTLTTGHSHPRPDQPARPTRITPAPYPFLFRRATVEPVVDELIECRQMIAELPPWTRTFQPTDRLDSQTSRVFQRRPKLLYLTGSWPLPDWFTGGGSSTKSRFVNPNGTDIERYAMTGVECPCGQVITKIGNDGSLDDHGAGCTPRERQRVAERIKTQRVRQLLIGAHLNLDSKVVARSIGVSRQSAMDLFRATGLSWKRLREIGRLRMAVTIACLRDHGYSIATLSEAFAYKSTRTREYATLGADLIEATGPPVIQPV